MNPSEHYHCPKAKKFPVLQPCEHIDVTKGKRLYLHRLSEPARLCSTPVISYRFRTPRCVPSIEIITDSPSIGGLDQTCKSVFRGRVATPLLPFELRSLNKLRSSIVQFSYPLTRTNFWPGRKSGDKKTRFESLSSPIAPRFFSGEACASGVTRQGTQVP